MAISREQAAKLRQDYLQKREELLQAKVDYLAVTLFDKVFNQYLANLELNNGFIVNNRKNINAIQGLDEIYSIFNTSQNVPVVQGFIKDLQSITPLNEMYFKTVSDKPVKPVTEKVIKTVNKSIGITDKGKIIHNGFADKVIKDKTVLKAIKQQTLKSITQKQGFQQFKEALKKTIQGETGKPLSGKVQQYYRNFAYDTFHRVDRLNSDLFAKDLGLRYFFWAGGIIETSRPICILANGKLVDSLEFKQMNYNKLKIEYRDGISQDWDPLRDLGYHGCRHRKDYVSDEVAERSKASWLDVQIISNSKIIKS